MSDNPKFTIPSTGKDYKIIRENVTWSQAVENSIIYGGNLAPVSYTQLTLQTTLVV